MYFLALYKRPLFQSQGRIYSLLRALQMQTISNVLHAFLEAPKKSPFLKISKRKLFIFFLNSNKNCGNGFVLDLVNSDIN